MAQCQEHPNYKGLRLGKNRMSCDSCVAFYNENRKNKVIEKRNRKKKVLVMANADPEENNVENNVTESNPQTVEETKGMSSFDNENDDDPFTDIDL